MQPRPRPKGRELRLSPFGINGVNLRLRLNKVLTYLFFCSSATLNEVSIAGGQKTDLKPSDSIRCTTQHRCLIVLSFTYLYGEVNHTYGP